MRDLLRRALGWKESESTPNGSGGDILRWALRWLYAPFDGFAVDYVLQADVEMRFVALTDVEMRLTANADVRL